MLGRPARAKPTPDGKAVLFLRAQPRVARLAPVRVRRATGKTRELLTPEDFLHSAEEHLTPEEKARRERQRVSVGGFTDFQLSEDGTHILLSLSGKLYLVQPRRPQGDRAEHRPRRPRPEVRPGRPDRLLRPRPRRLRLRPGDGARNGASRRGGSEKQPHGLAEFVAQEEMHRFTGYWWSPDCHVPRLPGKRRRRRRGVVRLRSDASRSSRRSRCPTRAPARPTSRCASASSPRPAAIPSWIEWDAKKYPVPGPRPLEQDRPADDPGADPRAGRDRPAPRRSEDGQDDAAA